MAKLCNEVSTHPAISSFVYLGFCAVCGLTLVSQSPLLAADKAAEKPKTPLRPMAFRQLTTAKSAAKSQVSKARSSPLQTLKPTASSQAKRFALTAPQSQSIALQDENSLADILSPAKKITPQSQPVAVEIPDDRIIMTALPEETAIAQSASATTRDVAVLSKIAATETPDENSDADANIDAGADSASEPLTGTFAIQQSPAQPAPAPPETAAPNQAGSTPDAAAVTAKARLSQASRLFAPSISYEGGTIIAQGTAEEPVRFENAGTQIIARQVRLDTVNQVVSAVGSVRVERQVQASRFSTFSEGQSGGNQENQLITETLQGENFEYNYGTRQGKLDATRVRLASFNISAEAITINGTKYVARNVIIRPGGLSDEEIRIYGTPPFSIRARTFTVDTGKAAPERNNSSDIPENLPAEQTTARTQVEGASLYFKNFRILPLPSTLLSRSLGGQREQETFQLTPRVTYNSADGLLVTVGLEYPFSSENPERLSLETDIGLSTRVGFRGGVALNTRNKLGRFAVGARINDVISSQLTNRIELDRLPEFSYRPPSFTLFELPGKRRAGLLFDFSAGDYRERFTTGSGQVVSGSRVQAQVRFTTRMGKSAGPYLDLLARTASYSNSQENLSTAGFEIGYVGSLISRINGRFSFGATKVNGNTPFEFDRVPIRKELRATFDVLLTPRYIIPIDLRYDLDKSRLREKTFGILRNYKTFAYGVTYQASRQELQFQVRQGF